MGLLAYTKARLDSWVNFVTSVGGAASRSAFSYEPDRLLTDFELEAMYEGDAYVSRIARVVPEEALRQGFAVRTGQPETDEWVNGRIAELQAASKLVEGWTWGRLYGGGGVILGANDGRLPEEPLDERQIESVPFLITFDKRELRPIRWYGDTTTRSMDQDPAFRSRSEALFGEPSCYELTRAGGTASETLKVHATRVIRFEGALTSRARKRANNGWSHSEIQRIYTAVQKFNGAWEASGALLQDSSQGVFRIKNLMAMMAGDASDQVKKRLLMMDITRSMSRSILVDADTESFERIESSALAGMPGAMDKFILFLAGAAEIPVTILLGQAPAGLNATGDSDIRWFYDRIKSAQENVLQRRLERIVRALLRSRDCPTGGREPEGWSIEFKKLWQLTEKEDADLRKAVADADAVYIDKQVVTPEEVAISRFRESGWNRDMSISIEAREQAQQADLEAAQGQDPALPPGSATPPGLPTGEPAKPEGQSVQQAALNGAQVASMMDIVAQVASRAIPRETGVSLLTTAFPVSATEADKILGEVGRTFFAEATPTPAGPPSPAPSVPPEPQTP